MQILCSIMHENNAKCIENYTGNTLCCKVSTTGLNPNELVWNGGPDACRNSQTDCPSNQLCQYKLGPDAVGLSWGDRCDDCPGRTWLDCLNHGYENEYYFNDCMDICATETYSLTRVIYGTFLRSSDFKG